MSDSSDTAVERQIEKLRTTPRREIEAATAAKRAAWMRQKHSEFNTPRRPTPRDGYELFIRRYLELSAEEAPVISESDSEIVWLSKNPCPTLDACQTLGLDTRDVCRACYEKPVQTMLSQLDPQLRFQRDYDEIRPHAPHCRETIVRVDFEALMRLAIEEAKASRREGNKGYGAVIAKGREVVACAHDTAATDGDPSAHAEVNAIRQAAAKLGASDLSGCVLFSTCEPCPMCASLAVWANVTSVVFGASIRETAALGKARILVDAQTIAASAPALLEIIPGVLRDDCLRLYADTAQRQ